MFIAALLTKARTIEATQMSFDRWMHNQAVVYIYNGIFLSHEKECTWVNSNEVAKTRAYYTEWSKSQKEKQISCINAHIWNLERWYWWTYLKGSSGDAGTENRLVDMMGEGEGGMTWESNVETYTSPYVKQIVGICCMMQETQTMLCDKLESWDGVGGGKEFQEGGDIYIHMAN